MGEVYKSFCCFGKRDSNAKKGIMDGKTFTKALKDSKIICKASGLTATDADLVFAKIAGRGCRKIGYLTFVKGLTELSKRGKKIPQAELVQKLIAACPASTGTTCDDVRLGRKDQFVGISTRGGPTTVETDPNSTGLAGLADRTPYDVRGRKMVSSVIPSADR